MKRLAYLVPVITLLALGTTVLYGQESVEQYLMGLNEPSKEDYIQLLYGGSHENQEISP